MKKNLDKSIFLQVVGDTPKLRILSRMFKLNEKNQIVQELSRLQWLIAKSIVHKKLGIKDKRAEIITS